MESIFIFGYYKPIPDIYIEVIMTFCDKLQTLRKNKGLTQEELAEKINVSRAAVAKWEAGVSQS